MTSIKGGIVWTGGLDAQVRIHHHLDEFFESDFGLPSQLLFRFTGITHEQFCHDVRAAVVAWASPGSTITEIEAAR